MRGISKNRARQNREAEISRTSCARVRVRVRVRANTLRQPTWDTVDLMISTGSDDLPVPLVSAPAQRMRRASINFAIDAGPPDNAPLNYRLAGLALPLLPLPLTPINIIERVSLFFRV